MKESQETQSSSSSASNSLTLEQQMSGLRKFGKVSKHNIEQDANSDAYANVDDDSDQLEELYDDLLNNCDLSLIFDGKKGKPFVLEDDEPVAKVRQDGFYDTEDKKPSSKLSQQGPIIVPRKRLRIEISNDQNQNYISSRTPAETIILPPTTPNVIDLNAIVPVLTPTTTQQSFAQQFKNEKKRYSKFQSRNDEQIAKGIVQILDGVVGVEMKNFDALAFTLIPTERQILYAKTRWRRTNRIWNIQNVTPSAYGEKYAPAKFAVEQYIVTQHAVLKQFHQVAVKDMDNLIERLVDTYKLALLATGDSQTVCEKIIGNIYLRPTKFEVYSIISKKRLGEIMKMQGQDFQMPHFSRQYQNNQLGRYNWNTFKITAIYQKSRGQGLSASKRKDFKRSWRYSKQQNKSDDEPPNQDDGSMDQIQTHQLRK
ncbi:MAG: hypothetical protein EZS28_019034 [Streblomastix strix]|uniref:Uncharacterized protein n=1 Tax=Streblomastix strix TaxID=222440 RepID=A0A5J4VS40_9EUKA|nr:MAG: hypothetical protein EZS28_019034 [Streblomastix strix]